MTNLAPIRFGTDGWRAVIAEDYTFANVERVAQAYADYLKAAIEQSEQSLVEQLVAVGQLRRDEAEVPPFSNVLKKAVASAFQLEIIGFDRRFLSEAFAKRAAEVLAGNGFRIALFSEAAPTPLISWAVKYLGASGGVVITASHNPPEFNGFKIKAWWGGSADPEITLAVEALVDANPSRRGDASNDPHQLLERAI